MIVYGVNPVLEALRAGAAREVHLTRRPDGRTAEVERLTAARGVRVVRTSPAELGVLTGVTQHQGVAAVLVETRRRWSLSDLVDGQDAPLIVVLDEVEDPQNVGAIVRTADAVGASGIVRQERRSAALNAAAMKASAGALAHVRIVDVVNVVRAMEELKSRGVWMVGLAGDGGQSYETVDYRPATAVVLGSEGTGLRRLVRDHCDFLARIPMRGHVSSLNVSAAAAVVLYEAVRQRASRG